MALDAFRTLSGSMVTGGPTKATFIFGFESFIISAILHVDVETGRGGEQHQQFEILGHLDGLLDGNLCGGASTTLLSSSIPAG